MIWRFAVVVLVMCFLSTPPILAGTWKDDFEDGDFDGWEVYNAEPEEIWEVEDGECIGQWATLNLNSGL